MLIARTRRPSTLKSHSSSFVNLKVSRTVYPTKSSQYNSISLTFLSNIASKHRDYFKFHILASKIVMIACLVCITIYRSFVKIYRYISLELKRHLKAHRILKNHCKTWRHNKSSTCFINKH